MAKILDFVRRPSAPAPGADVARLLEDFSIEVMPRTAAKVEDFRARHEASNGRGNFCRTASRGRTDVVNGAFLPSLSLCNAASPTRVRRKRARADTLGFSFSGKHPIHRIELILDSVVHGTLGPFET